MELYVHPVFVTLLFYNVEQRRQILKYSVVQLIQLTYLLALKPVGIQPPGQI